MALALPPAPDPKENAPKDGAGAVVELAENEKAADDDEVGFSTFAAAGDEEEPKLKGEAAAVVEVVGAVEKLPNEKGLAGSEGALVGCSDSLLTAIVFS